MKQPSSGFSLVELSIVLVILGLLAGGILAGQSLIRAAELRTVAADSSRYTAALYSFRDRYFALPGDMTNATQFWGAANSNPTTCLTTASTDAKTCNGNGDGQIWSTDPGTGAHWSESFRAWQQMANAGLVEGQYNGIPGPTANTFSWYVQSIPGQNIPKSRIANGGYFITWYDLTNDPYIFDIHANTLIIGATSTTDTPSLPLFKPEEAWNLDIKLDDGKPGTGKIVSNKNTSCATATTNNAGYALTQTNIGCALFITL